MTEDAKQSILQSTHCPRAASPSNNTSLSSISKPWAHLQQKTKTIPPPLSASVYHAIYYCSCFHFRIQPWQWNMRTSPSKSPERWESFVSGCIPWWKPEITTENGQRSSVCVSQSNVSSPDSNDCPEHRKPCSELLVPVLGPELLHRAIILHQTHGRSCPILLRIILVFFLFLSNYHKR